jgi:hypothetical protein
MLFGVNGAAMAGAAALVLRALWLAIAARRRLNVDTSIFAVLPAGSFGPRPSQTPAE